METAEPFDLITDCDASTYWQASLMCHVQVEFEKGS